MYDALVRQVKRWTTFSVIYIENINNKTSYVYKSTIAMLKISLDTQVDLLQPSFDFDWNIKDEDRCIESSGSEEKWH